MLQEKRLLQKYGVEPEIISISASPIVLQTLLAGEIDVSAISVTTLVSSRLAGADTVMILGMVRTFVDHILSQQNITSIEQLKGKIGGVNRIGSTSDMGLRFALRRLNIDPEKDTRIITAGGNPERFAALTKGVINFTIMPEPFVRQALQLGFRHLFDIGSLKIPFWWNAVLTREAIVKAKRPLLLKFTRAMIEATHFNKTHKEEAKAIWGKYLRITDQEASRARLADLHCRLSRQLAADSGRRKNPARRHRAARTESRQRRSATICRPKLGARSRSHGLRQAALQKIAELNEPDVQTSQMFTPPHTRRRTIKWGCNVLNSLND